MTCDLQDALDEIARQKPRDLFKPLRVHFIGEDGIDAGGVKKEFFQLLVTELLCPDYGMLIFQPVCCAAPLHLPCLAYRPLSKRIHCTAARLRMNDIRKCMRMCTSWQKYLMDLISNAFNLCCNTPSV